MIHELDIRFKKFNVEDVIELFCFEIIKKLIAKQYSGPYVIGPFAPPPP